MQQVMQQGTASESFMPDDANEGTHTEVAEPIIYTSSRLSMEAYEQQKKEYTRLSLDALTALPAYQQKLNSCKSCWSCWLDDIHSATCVECGGYALHRPCPVCEGLCGAVWKRDIYMSHSLHEAHWDGTCRLPEEQQEFYLRKVLRETGGDEDEMLLDAMQDLKTSCITDSMSNIGHWDANTECNSSASSVGHLTSATNVGHWDTSSGVGSTEVGHWGTSGTQHQEELTGRTAGDEQMEISTWK